MAFKTFTARNGEVSELKGHKEITLYGGFFDYKTPKTFKSKRVMVLSTGSKSMLKHPEYLFQTVSADDIAYIERELKKVKEDPGYRHLKVCLEGRGTDNRVAYTTVDYGD